MSETVTPPVIMDCRRFSSRSLLNLRLEVGDAGAEGGLDEVDVLVLADEVAAGEEVLGEGAELQFAAEIFVAYLEAHAVSLALEDGALHQDLSGALCHVGEQEVRQVLLLKLALGKRIDLGGLDGGAAGEAAEESRLTNGGEDSGVRNGAVIEDAGHKGYHHGDNGGPDDEGEKNFDEGTVLLQDTNHA